MDDFLASPPDFPESFLMTKILLLGLGRWGLNHLRNLNNLPVELYVAEMGDRQLEPARKLGLPVELSLIHIFLDAAGQSGKGPIV